MEKIENFLRIENKKSDGNGSGDGSGDGYGSSYGNGNGDGSGNGYGYGSGNGSGNGNGYGSGDGSGDGYGSSYGNGYGSGNGYGDGDGYGYGSGNGNGNGSGIKQYNNQNVYYIDNIPTIILSIHNNIASGLILHLDFTTTKCFVAKAENTFAHGSTIKEAVTSLQAKLLLNKPIKDRIIEFKKEFSELNTKYPSKSLYDWHFLLTGSCEFGRKSFCEQNNINLEKDKFTIIEFIELTKNSYNGNIIQQLEESYKNT